MRLNHRAVCKSRAQSMADRRLLLQAGIAKLRVACALTEETRFKAAVSHRPCAALRERERQRDRDKERQRDRDRQTDIQTDRQTNRQPDRDRDLMSKQTYPDWLQTHKRFKGTLFITEKTQHANFPGNPLCQATKLF